MIDVFILGGVLVLLWAYHVWRVMRVARASYDLGAENALKQMSAW